MIVYITDSHATCNSFKQVSSDSLVSSRNTKMSKVLKACILKGETENQTDSHFVIWEVLYFNCGWKATEAEIRE